MPVSEDHALRQFEIEALRSINRNLEKLYQRADQTTTALHEIDARLIRIESNQVNEDVATLQAKVDVLEDAQQRRAGAVTALEWGARFGPWLLTLAFGILAFMGWERAA